MSGAGALRAAAARSGRLLGRRRPGNFSSAAIRRRWMSSSGGVSSYEFPLRTEAPVVTRTIAAEQGQRLSTAAPLVADTDVDVGSPLAHAHNIKDRSRIPPDSVDHFDDKQTLSDTERLAALHRQRSEINTHVDRRHRIEPTVPPEIPPNAPFGSLTVPETIVSTLPNGVRVASQEMYGQVTTVGLLAECGSRYERSGVDTGVNHLLELLAFQSTEHRSASDIITRMDELGGATFANSSREQMMYCVDILRPNAGEAMELLAETVLRPRIDDMEVEDLKQVIEFQTMDILPEVRMGEGLQMAAYCPLTEGGEAQQLGKPHFCPLEALPNLNARVVHDFRHKHLLNPSGFVIAGAGIGHEELVELAATHFSDVPVANPNEAPQLSKTVPSVYTGGEYRLPTKTVDGFTRIALAFELGGWHSDDLVPACVLQTLLGGGNSFSAGGPGKGMYSRLYREVLNRYHWAESAEAFTSFHSESGLLGISGSSIPAKSRDLTRVIAEHFANLAINLVSDEELDRARNMLKCNVLTQLESRLVLFEDIGRQILTYGKREDSESMCKKIDSVTKEDVRNIAKKALAKPPTLSTVGDDLKRVPSYEDVKGWFRH